MVDFELKEEGNKYTFEDFYRVIQLLRAPGGCPWDREQTHESLIKPMIEEAYEAVDAIEKKSDEKLKEELGDVLLQVIFHSIIAEENGEFVFSDITDMCTRKMIFRHSHIFGTDVAETADAVLDNWDKKKLEEKGIKSLEEDIDDIPKSFPALMRAAKVAKKRRKAGADTRPAEEITCEEDAGRKLYELARACDKAKIDPELALKAYLDKEMYNNEN